MVKGLEEFIDQLIYNLFSRDDTIYKIVDYATNKDEHEHILHNIEAELDSDVFMIMDDKGDVIVSCLETSISLVTTYGKETRIDFKSGGYILINATY
jgi:hypothetical protein